MVTFVNVVGGEEDDQDEVEAGRAEMRDGRERSASNTGLNFIVAGYVFAAVTRKVTVLPSYLLNGGLLTVEVQFAPALRYPP